jgi:hypothetical protein
LEIKEVDEASASVSLFSSFGPHISHPYWDGKVTVSTPATYYNHISDFEAQLWKAGGGFFLNPNHEYSTRLGELHEEILSDLSPVPGPDTKRYKEDDFLDAFYGFLDKLKHL